MRHRVENWETIKSNKEGPYIPNFLELQKFFFAFDVTSQKFSIHKLNGQSYGIFFNWKKFIITYHCKHVAVIYII